MDMTKTVDRGTSGQGQSYKPKLTKATFSNIQKLEKYVTRGNESKS